MVRRTHRRVVKCKVFWGTCQPLRRSCVSDYNGSFLWRDVPPELTSNSNGISAAPFRLRLPCCGLLPGQGWVRYWPFRCPLVPFPLSHCSVVPLFRWRAPGPVGRSRSCWRVPLHGRQRAAAIGEPLHVAGISGVSMWDSKCR